MILLRKAFNIVSLLCISSGLVSCAGSESLLQQSVAPRGNLSASGQKIGQQHIAKISTGNEITATLKGEPKTEASPAPASPIVKQEASSSFSDAGDLIGPGVLKPTIYYFPVYNEDKEPCVAGLKRSLYGTAGIRLIDVCPLTEAGCSLQGSCAVIQKGKLRSFNIIGLSQGKERYFPINDDDCQYGYGVQSICLDPFYTLAADLTIYKPGDVIFIPGVRGALLPNGTKHNGYFIVRDRGRGVKGRGRFDFFTGFFHWRDSNNPFHKLGLGDIKTQIPYYRVQGETAKKVISQRAYPNYPRD